MSGAACLCAEAALRSGAGLVTVATPRRVQPIVAARVISCLTRPLPETEEGTIAQDAGPELVRLADESDCVALGPGLSQNQETRQAVRFFLDRAIKPIVIDADAINILASLPNLLMTSACSARILTPHPGEMARLLKTSIATVQHKRLKTARDFARQHKVSLVLKGRGTIVTDGKRAWKNPTGNPGMATGGTGDVLTGMIVAFLGQGLAPFEAAQLGVYLHGLAGDLAAGDLGQISLTAEDLLAYLPKAFLSYDSRSRTKRK